jgi:hypothetical protein
MKMRLFRVVALAVVKKISFVVEPPCFLLPVE